MNLIKKCLVGEPAKIVRSGNATLEGMEGTITNETKNTITIKTNQGEKKVIKNTVRISINGIEVEGKELMGTPEERIKKKVKK